VHNTKVKTILYLLILICNIFCYASETEQSSKWDISVALGYGQRSNPLLNADEINLAIDLNIAWYGERWFFDNGDLGYTLVDNYSSTLNIVARVNSDRVFFSKTNTQYISLFDSGLDGQPIVTDVLPVGLQNQFSEFNIPNRDYALEIGLEYLQDGNWGQFTADIYQDSIGTHDGLQATINYSYPIQLGRWLIEPGIAALWKSKKLNNYYWGLNISETQNLLPVYNADSGINLQARLLMVYPINKKWSFVSAVDFEKLSSEIKNSPIVEEDNVFAWYSGFRYRF